MIPNLFKMFQKADRSFYFERYFEAATDIISQIETKGFQKMVNYFDKRPPGAYQVNFGRIRNNGVELVELIIRSNFPNVQSQDSTTPVYCSIEVGLMFFKTTDTLKKLDDILYFYSLHFQRRWFDSIIYYIPHEFRKLHMLTHDLLPLRFAAEKYIKLKIADAENTIKNIDSIFDKYILENNDIIPIIDVIEEQQKILDGPMPLERSFPPHIIPPHIIQKFGLKYIDSKP